MEKKIKMKKGIYHPRSKEDCAHLLAERFLSEESKKPENMNLDLQALHNRIYLNLVNRFDKSELKSMYYDTSSKYELRRKPRPVSRNALEIMADEIEEMRSIGHVETLKKYFEKLVRVCGDCFPPKYSHIREVKGVIEMELRRLKHVSKRLHEEFSNEYDTFREQYPVLKRGEEELVLTG